MMVKVKRIRFEDTKEWLVFAEIADDDSDSGGGDDDGDDDGTDGDILAIIKPDVKYIPDSPKLKETVEELIQKDDEYEPDIILGARKLQQFFFGKRIISVTFIETKADKFEKKSTRRRRKKSTMLVYVYSSYVNEGEYHDLIIHDRYTVERLFDICNEYGRRKNKMVTYAVEY
jgi:hypothetical protein